MNQYSYYGMQSSSIELGNTALMLIGRLLGSAQGLYGFVGVVSKLAAVCFIHRNKNEKTTSAIFKRMIIKILIVLKRLFKTIPIVEFFCFVTDGCIVITHPAPFYFPSLIIRGKHHV